MSFRKRNVALTRSPSQSDNVSNASQSSDGSSTKASQPPIVSAGVRPSPIDGRPTTSTGIASLDGILAGHAGLPLGNSICIGESGTTDYAGALLRLYAAEGVVQGHKVHVIGMGEAWGKDLPGLSEDKDDKRRKGKEKAEQMKIAWRYEGLGQWESARGSPAQRLVSQGGSDAEPAVFCHKFDLAKRLALPVGTAVNHVAIPRAASPFPGILQSLQQALASSPADSIHRLAIPSLLSPALYPEQASQASNVLPFLHGLRALLRQYSTRVTAIITIPLTLYPRFQGLVRWIELLSDGVLELSPFPYSYHESLATSAGATKDEERPQGMLAVHKLPVFHEKGGGGLVEGLGEDLAFTLSRRKFVIAKFSLPPLEGDREAQEDAGLAAAGSAMPRKEDLEF